MKYNQKEILEMFMNNQLDEDKAVEMIDQMQKEEDNHDMNNQQEERDTVNVNQPLHNNIYYRPVWEKIELIDKGENRVTGTILLFDRGQGTADELSAMLQGMSDSGEIIHVRPGSAYKKLAEDIYEINSESTEDYERLMVDLKEHGQIPSGIIHTWNYVQEDRDLPVNNEELEDSLKRGVYSVFNISRVLMNLEIKKSVRLLYLFHETKEKVQPQDVAVGGFARSIRLENPNFDYKTIQVKADNAHSVALFWAVRELQSDENNDHVEILYRDKERYVRRVTEPVQEKSVDKDNAAPDSVPLKENGVYLITGGAGGLGLIFSRYFSEKYRAKLVLAGRSEVDEEIREKLKGIEAFGGEAVYLQADVCSYVDMENVVREARKRYGSINGVIHGAGVIEDAFIMKKDKESFERVLNPKVYGLLNLDQVTAEEKLDFFVMFSSLTSVIGNMGQSDYASGNRYMDSYAELREQLRGSGKRSGVSLSINWPLWKDGGMRLHEESERLLFKISGMKPLSSETGIRAFESGMKSISTNPSQNQLIIAEGDKIKVDKLLNINVFDDRNKINRRQNKVDNTNYDELYKSLQQDLITIVAELLMIEADDLDIEADMSKYGFDSIVLVDLTNKINKKYNIGLLPTLFFEDKSMKEFCDYLIKEYEDALCNYYKDIVRDKNITTPGPQIESTIKRDQEFLEYNLDFNNRFNGFQSEEIRNDLIAIIGINGVFPESKNLETFWNNLESGKSLISEIPEQRWKWQEFFGDPHKEVNKTNSKWGGFIENVDKFNARFFNISPREAELMDPQQRIFLEIVWKTIEDAGYKVSAFSGTNTGLFVGVANCDYFEIQTRNHHEIEAYTSTGIAHSVLANRISYLLNLHGPSEPVDTACSSSLVAIHHAVRAIQNGDCEMAIAGGVNVILTPSVYITFSKAGMLAPDGRCKTFDKSANGYVRGEGAGAVLLKPFNKAVEDGDHIYAVIKGNAVNHGGHVSSLTVPNPDIQANLLVNAYGNAGIDPSTVSYIETHGTGTSLGDPVEINGLKKAFKELNKRLNRDTGGKNYCGVGSVKTNIGHLETAAGIAGVIKVLLAMKHRKIPATVNFKELNPYIEISESPFYIAAETREWNCLNDDNGNPVPRRAGVSSFGFGGANAHIVLEEYVDSRESNRNINSDEPAIIVLSAKRDEQLRDYAESLRDYVKSDIAKVDGSGVAGSPRYLGDIAYTLQTGRDAFDERLAVVAESCDELVRKLDDYLNGAKGIEGVYRGRVKSGGSREGRLGGTKEEKDFVLQLFNARRYSKIAAFWVEGAEIDWEVFNRNKGFRRISLPTYPFARERYWISTSDASGKMDTGIVRGLHPLVDVNESTLEEERFRKSFTGSEFYLKDHVVAGKETLPGVAYIEMARAAGEIAKGSPVTSIRNIVWASPITIDSKNREGREVIISIYPGDSTIGFEVSTEQEGGGKIVHTQGKIAYGPGDNRQVDLQTGEKEFAIEVIKGRCTAIKKREDIYRRFKAAGISYGTGFQCMEEIRSNGREALSRIKIPEVVKSGAGDYVLHPSLMDGALQSVMGLAEDDEAFQSGFYLPFALGGVEIIRPLTESCYAYVTIGDGDKKAGSGVKRYDISILDESGDVLVRLKGFSVRALRGGDLNKRTSVEVVERNERYYHPVWERVELTGTGGSRETGTILLLDRGEKEKGGQWLNREEIVKGGKIIHVIPGTAYKKLAANRYEIDPESSEDYEKLFKELGVRGLMPASILHTWNYVKEAGGLPNSKEALDSSLKMGIYAVFNISNAMMKCKIKERVRLLYLFDSTKGGVQPQDAALGGFAKTIRQENPKFDYRTIQIDSAEADSVVLDWVVRELQTEENQDHVEVLYRDNERYVRKVEEFVPEKIEKREKSGKESTIPASVPLKENGVYVITGGAGGLGLIFSRYLSEKYRAKLVLTGRSEVDEEIGEKLKGIEELGGEVVYLQADVCSNTDMEKVVREAKQRYGSVDGVIHGAGVIEDVFVMKKDKGSFERVLGPKVYGLLNLDRVTVEEELDFFVMFSSLASVIGNIGQSDYASGNRYMDSYAELRERLRGEGKRSGVSLSINWPLWKDGGMRLHEESERMLFKISGMKPLGSEAGIRAFECALASGKSQCIVIDGEREKVNRLLQISESAGIAVEEATEDSGAFSETGIKDDDLKGRVQQEMIGLLSEQLKVEKSEIDIDADISEYGVDSIMIMNMMNEMEQRYGKVVEASVIMEHPTVSSMSDYLIEKKIIPLERIFGTTEDTKIEVVAEGDINRLKEEAVILPIKRTQRPRFVDSKSVGVKGIARPEGGPESGKIAIIGMSGCFPGSKDLERFWENLRDGKDLIMDVPEQRWNIEEYFSLDKAAFNKAYSRWGGFIEDIEMFDAGFFGISESDAAGIDPQHRILLERTQELLDRCGYTKDEMSRSRTGVYIGGGSSKYNSMGEFSGDQAGNIVVNLIQNMMAARISDFYDLRGPSLTMDTACSSSLVAIHNACQCLRGGEIEMAITGGVELLLDSSGHVAFSQAKVLSDDGVSHVFDKKANGFVLGEGSGLVLLKRLENAIRDGDQIDGVILGSAVINDGHTMGLTTLNLRHRER
ncbi:beta-ketoacyl synthase [Candidatus Scalindua japonica]|uniref:Beta-ketoacyl synthase n=1 Tax=Candidatus Scalindua japonica TaxID=1284222 RepID=A0A286TTC1_9BACT|nr:type I polyketide synthase [Candidatus Scalindua japonica]GAX59142.1 beta-ketoacyl synthase [Candidatus Scalindua japonica]